MSLFSYSLAFLCTEHPSFWTRVLGANFSVVGGLCPPPLQATL